MLFGDSFLTHKFSSASMYYSAMRRRELKWQEMGVFRHNGPILTCLWGVAVCVGIGILADYETRPGDTATSPDEWPTMSRIVRATGQPHLVMFAHPRCPCTRASIGELAVVMSQRKGRLAAHVLFLKPAEFEKKWTQSDLWRSAASIPGVTVAVDESGAEAQYFGAITSGHVVLYDGDGRLLFSGGITGSRGHFGDNYGRSTVVALVRDCASQSPTRRYPAECSVYGCRLFNSTR